MPATARKVIQNPVWYICMGYCTRINMAARPAADNRSYFLPVTLAHIRHTNMIIARIADALVPTMIP